MNAEGYIQSRDDLVALNAWREVLESEHLELEWAVRHVLRPAGFGHDPAQWQGLAHSAMTFLNREYRHEAKVDVQEGARKIRRMQGVDKLAPQIVEQVRNYHTMVALVEQFKALLAGNQDELTAIDRATFEGMVQTFESGIATFKRYLDTARDGMMKNKELFRILDRPSKVIRAYTVPLNDAVSQRQNVVDARFYLNDLVDVNQKRLDLVDRAAAIFAGLSRELVAYASMPRDSFEERIAAYANIVEELGGQKDPQRLAIAGISSAILRASTSPATLSGLQPDTTVLIADLRRAHLQFAEIVDAVNILQELFTPFKQTVVRNIDRLRLRSIVFVIRVD